MCSLFLGVKFFLAGNPSELDQQAYLVLTTVNSNIYKTCPKQLLLRGKENMITLLFD